MNEAIICQPSPVKTLSVTNAPLRELLNFLTYQKHPELLNERARRQPLPALGKIPTNINELKKVLGAEKCEKNRKLFFDCTRSDVQRGILIHNINAQFWIHYFRCGIGLVNLSFFSHLATAENQVRNQTRNVAHSYEYQWFTHDLDPKFLTREISKTSVRKLGDYFIERINPNLVNSYTIYFENRQIREPYKFVSGSFARLKEVLTWTRFVCERLKREKEPNGKTWVSPHVTITCGNLKTAPAFEHSSETFINVVGALAVRENAPYTVLRECFGRRVGSECYDRERNNKHRIFLNLEQENKDIPARVKIAACDRLINWLKEQGAEGEQVIKAWKMGN